jgi:cation diffusion facilitator CzcD-associated flavoprotein CzcO
MTTKLKNNERLIKHMIPDFAVGCRRPTPGNGYLEALNAPNVRVVTDMIEEVVPEGIRLSTGEVLKVDAFICATGFDISFWPRFELIGQDGVSMKQKWQKKPEAYLSLAVDKFPNYFSESPSLSEACGLLILNVCSVSWSKCSNRSWICPPNPRACYKVYDQRDEEIPIPKHQIPGA